jgi:hypothetical protein
MSADEYRDFLDKEASGRLGVSAEEFGRRYIAGELDDSDLPAPEPAATRWRHAALASAVRSSSA